MTFAGFDGAAVALLADLPEFDAPAFAEHRAVLTTGLGWWPRSRPGPK